MQVVQLDESGLKLLRGDFEVNRSFAVPRTSINRSVSRSKLGRGARNSDSISMLIQSGCSKRIVQDLGVQSRVHARSRIFPVGKALTFIGLFLRIASLRTMVVQSWEVTRAVARNEQGTIPRSSSHWDCEGYRGSLDWMGAGVKTKFSSSSNRQGELWAGISSRRPWS